MTHGPVRRMRAYGIGTSADDRRRLTRWSDILRATRHGNVKCSSMFVTMQSTRGEGLAGSHGCEVAQDGIGGHGGLPSSEIARIDAGSWRREGRAASSLRRHRLLARKD